MLPVKSSGRSFSKAPQWIIKKKRSHFNINCNFQTTSVISFLRQHGISDNFPNMALLCLWPTSQVVLGRKCFLIFKHEHPHSCSNPHPSSCFGHFQSQKNEGIMLKKWSPLVFQHINQYHQKITLWFYPPGVMLVPALSMCLWATLTVYVLGVPLCVP